MTVLLQPFLSGNVFFVGLVIVAMAAFCRGKWARVAVVTGLALTVLSAVPIGIPAYIALTAGVVVWLLMASSPRLSPARGVLALVATAVALMELPFHLGRAARIERRVPIILLGDSLSAGNGAWPRTFSAAGGCAVENKAYPGARLADGRRQLGHPTRPCEVLIALGGNDILGEAGADPFRADLESLLRAVAANGCQGTMLELPLFPFQTGYGGAQRRLAAQYGIALVPRRVLATALTLPGHTTDGLHLGSVGHSWLGHELGRWIRCPRA